MRRLTNGASSSYEFDKVQQVLQKRQANITLKSTQSQIVVCLMLNVLILFDLYHQVTARMLVQRSVIICLAAWWIESVVFLLLTVNMIWNGLAYMKSVIFPTYVEITKSEQSLLNISQDERGFRLSPEKMSENKPIAKINFSPTRLSPNYSNTSFSPVLMNSSVGTPETRSNEFVQHSPSMFNSSYDSFLVKSLDGSFSGSHSLPMNSGDNSTSRRRVTSATRLSAGKPQALNTEKAVDSFLEEVMAKEKSQQLVQAELSCNVASSFWNASRTTTDYLADLKKFQYQIAPRAGLTSNSSSSVDNPEQSSKFPAEQQIWSKTGISQQCLDVWIENLRYWIGQTIVQRLAQEINKVNKELRSLGTEDTLIGEVSVSKLKDVAFVKSTHLPTLNNILAYLELSTHQEYLVNRIKALGSDGCISNFNWDGGSAFNGKSWGDYLPTDSAVIMHLFCTYLDARFPANPRYPEGKAFSSQHLMITPEKPNFQQKKEYLTIYQTAVCPPHYKLIIGSDIYDIPKGRNNIFQVILLLLLHIKEKENGVLGSVNFGPSGVNILWVLTEKYR